MSRQFPLGKRFRTAVSLGFLGCLIAAGMVSSQAPTSESSVAASKAVIGTGVATPRCGNRCAKPNDGSHLTLTVQVEIGLPHEFGVAFEEDDSLEMLRVDIQRCIGGIDWVERGSRVGLKAASPARPNFSLPLLV